MTKYIVKIAYIITDDDPNFTDKTYVEYRGKFDTVIIGDFMDATFAYYVKNYGYNRKCDAMRNYSFKNDKDFSYKGRKWHKSTTIMKVEV